MMEETLCPSLSTTVPSYIDFIFLIVNHLIKGDVGLTFII